LFGNKPSRGSENLKTELNKDLGLSLWGKSIELSGLHYEGKDLKRVAGAKTWWWQFRLLVASTARRQRGCVRNSRDEAKYISGWNFLVKLEVDGPEQKNLKGHRQRSYREKPTHKAKGLRTYKTL
jgi:hypothetical protein